jgi:anaerobic glycerol-3-phosphate dehydrogenase
VPATVAKGELGALRGKRVAVVGIKEVGDYDAVATAQAMSELCGLDAFADEISMPELPIAASLTDIYGRRAPDPHGSAMAVAYPPGLSHLPQIGFELLASPPSPHGWRLQQAIGLGAIPAEITAFETSRDGITAARSSGRAFHADAFVLATGRHIGGGLRAGRATVEPLLGLGVFRDGVLASTLGVRLHHLEYLDAAEVMRLGLSTDKRLHPLAEDGSVPYTNLYAAGAVLGGYEYAGPCGFGVPIVTGWLAGRYAAKQ